MRTAMAALVAATVAIALTVASAGAAKGGRPDKWTNQQILEAGYAGNPVVAGAYNEGLAENQQLSYASACFGDIASARAWAIGQTGAPDAERETSRFFEFSYVQPNGLSNLLRAHSCSYFNAPNTFNGERTNSGIIDFLEYQWYVESHGYIGTGALEAVKIRGKAEAGIDFYYVQMDGGGLGLCDVAKLMKAEHRVDKDNGSIKVTRQEVKQVPGNCYPF